MSHERLLTGPAGLSAGLRYTTNHPNLLKSEEKIPASPPGGLWGTQVNQTVIMRMPSYVLPQCATHCSEAPYTSTVLDLHQSKGEQCLHF